MMPRIWTDTVIDDVLSRIRTGERTADIAEEYCTTGAALRSVIYHHRGGAVREAREDMYADMGKLWAAGWKTTPAASDWRTTSRTIHGSTRNSDSGGTLYEPTYQSGQASAR